MFSACKSGDLEGLKNLLPYVPEAINEIMDENGDNLLMWCVHRVCVSVVILSECVTLCTRQSVCGYVWMCVLRRNR